MYFFSGVAMLVVGDGAGMWGEADGPEQEDGQGGRSVGKWAGRRAAGPVEWLGGREGCFFFPGGGGWREGSVG